MPKFMVKYILAVLLFLVNFNFPLFAQTVTDPNELETLQKEISRYEQQLKQSKEKEKNTANLIAGLDREIDLTTGLLVNLRQELAGHDGQIETRQQQVARLEEQILRLRALIKKRLVSFYKFGRRRDYELLLTGASWQQANVWLKYQKLIAQNDRRNLVSLVDKKERLKVEQQLLRQDMAKKTRTLAESESRAEQLKTSRTKRQSYLSTLQKDSEYLQQHLLELQEAQKQIKNFITKSEKERTDKQRQISHRKEEVVQKPTRDYTFASRRGRLPWPTQGDVISHFGTYRHPTLNTVTENLGIEIRAPLGAPVHVVDAGQVQTITWQRGRGNIIIVSHDEGYYTVYTHLAEIRVNLMDNVDSGQVIGTVGDSGSLNGPVLHFQIWKNTDNLNPEEWLS